MPDFDLTQHGDVTHVERLTVTFAGAEPVATVTSLQSLDFQPRDERNESQRPRA